MTVQEAIERADAVKPNGYTTATKVAWLNSLEGSLALEVFLMAPAEATALLHSAEALTDVLLLDPPYDDLYVYWLEAMIDEANGEYDRYASSMQIYNARLSEFVCWLCQAFDPVQGYLGEETIYGII